jgi:hypothetical protein
MTDEMLLLLATRNKSVTPNIFGRKFSVDFPNTREDWYMECVDLVAPDGSLCEDRAGAGVFFDILDVRESYALGSHAAVFQSEVYAILACSEYCISEGIVNRAVSNCSDSRAALLPLNCMACLPELYYSAEILFRNWLCLTEFDWCGSLDTLVSMGMRRPMHLQE